MVVVNYYIFYLVLDIRPPARPGVPPSLCAGGDNAASNGPLMTHVPDFLITSPPCAALASLRLLPEHGGRKTRFFFLIARRHRIQPPPSQAGLALGWVSKPRLVLSEFASARTKVTAKERTGVLGCPMTSKRKPTAVSRSVCFSPCTAFTGTAVSKPTERTREEKGNCHGVGSLATNLNLAVESDVIKTNRGLLLPTSSQPRLGLVAWWLDAVAARN